MEGLGSKLLTIPSAPSISPPELKLVSGPLCFNLIPIFLDIPSPLSLLSSTDTNPSSASLSLFNLLYLSLQSSSLKQLPDS